MPRKTQMRMYIADGFYYDCEELIQKCLRADVVNYNVFCNNWKDMNFAQLFWGRQLGSELAELAEEALNVAKTYFITNNDNIEESIAGLFLVYGLMNLQPYSGFAPLRITPDDVVAIKKIEMAARKSNRYDVLYILGSVLIKGPVEYHVHSRDYGYEASIKKYLIGFAGMEMPGQRTTGVLSHRSEELDILRDINSLTKKYSEAKDTLTKSGIWSDKLNYSNSAFAKELDSSFKKVLSGTYYSKYTDNESTQEPVDTDAYNSLQTVKMKAMSLNTQIARHREGVEERSKKLKEKAVENTNSPNKAKKPAPKRKIGYRDARKNRYKFQMSSDSSDTETSLPSVLNVPSSTELNTFRHIDNTGTPNRNTVTEKNIDIQIETLPVLISIDRDKEYEFEIIDNMQTETNEQCIDKDTKINKRKLSNDSDSDEPLDKIKKVTTVKEFDVPISNKAVISQKTETAKIKRKKVPFDLPVLLSETPEFDSMAENSKTIQNQYMAPSNQPANKSKTQIENTTKNQVYISNNTAKPSPKTQLSKNEEKNVLEIDKALEKQDIPHPKKRICKPGQSQSPKNKGEHELETNNAIEEQNIPQSKKRGRKPGQSQSPKNNGENELETIKAVEEQNIPQSKNRGRKPGQSQLPKNKGENELETNKAIEEQNIPQSKNRGRKPGQSQSPKNNGENELETNKAIEEQNIPQSKKRGRKPGQSQLPKNKGETELENVESPQPKKRGRKPRQTTLPENKNKADLDKDKDLENLDSSQHRKRGRKPGQKNKIILNDTRITSPIRTTRSSVTRLSYTP